MKKVVLALVAILTVCTALVSFAAEATGEYTIFNATGEPVTEFYFYKNGSADKGANLAENFKKDRQTITYTGDEADVLTVEFVTESGYTAKFETLHVEVAPVTLLAADAMTGATPISFFKPQGTGEYTVYNRTGENLKELYLFPAGSEDKGENLAPAFTDGQTLTYTGDIDTTLVLSFTTEGGYSAAFETLHIETTPLTLLAQDAMTGATPITFFAPEA